MDRVPVSSSNLSSVGYDEADQVLEIEFNGGSVYQYFDVPKRVHQDLMNAASHGKYFHQYVKDNYDCDQLR